ncbi:alpha-L-rhamnosidase [Halococcus sp. IIIV-5B]|uniref:alpha-L-rhamnosidase n=1 Tax=Halococcus sp. IIIV-5B TaxID=2321230 RepID=UPI000E75D1E6|nr:alpha-L-rhamnosidase [Halococcus sp. IIIV-5B]RJT07886.1 hydrolase [Halococcus sp. IIIV-5B]
MTTRNDSDDTHSECPPIPIDLRVEYERDPLNLEPMKDDCAERPRFSWSGVPETFAEGQSAYRIIVAQEAHELEQDRGQMWDSGKVDSNRSIQIPYDGPVLSADETYYWKVRVWNQDRKRSEWSDTARFSTSISDSDEQWEGDWIGADLDAIESSEGHSKKVPPNPLFRTEFDLDDGISEARLHVCGLGYNVPHLNGERIGDHVLDPAITDYEETVLYTTYEVADVLKRGRNAIGVAVGRGRYGEPLENTWFWDETPWWNDPQLIVQLNIIFDDGSTKSFSSGEDWRTTDGPTRYDSLFDGEEYDARREQPGWTDVDFDDTNWETSKIVDAPKGDLQPQRVQPVRIQDTITPVDRSSPEDDVFVFDMGVMIAGWTRLTVDGPEGTEVRISMGEKLDDDGTVIHSWSPGYPEPIQDDTYILRGNGTETWEPSFSYKGFRYVQIEGYPGTPSGEEIQGVLAHTDLEAGDDSDFSCSNELLNRIHENTRRALLNNHHGVPQDTPVYEKNGWTGDAQAMAVTAMYNFDMARFYQKWLRDLRDAQFDSGEVPVIVPTSDWSYENAPGWPAVQGPTPGWDAAYFIIPWVMYQYNGDKRVLQHHYQSMKIYLQWFESYFDGYVPEMGLGDWATPGEKEVPITATSYYYRELDILAAIASTLGYSDESDKYNEKKRLVADAFNDGFYDSSSESYGTDDVDSYVQTSNILPLAFGMVPEDRVDSVVDSLVNDIEREHDGHLFTGLFGTKHILPVLTRHGHHDLAYTVATQTTYPSWGHWVVNGMTALLEYWPLDARSRDHHFLGTIDEWFYQYLAGIREPVEPGFKRIKIAPKPVADLESAGGRVDTIHGVIDSEWELTADGLALAVTIPWNTTGEIWIPTLGGDPTSVRVDGTNIWEDGSRTAKEVCGVNCVGRENEWIVVDVNSGSFSFELERTGSRQ